MEYVYKRILFSDKKELNTDTCYDMDELENIILSKRSQAQKTTYCIIPFIWNFKNREIYMEKCELVVAYGWKVWGKNGESQLIDIGLPNDQGVMRMW